MTEDEAFAAVAERVLPGARVLGIRRLTGGVIADARALTLEDRQGRRRTVVVRQHGAPAWEPGHDDQVATEFALLEAVQRAGGVPVAEPMLLDTSRTLLDRPYMVISLVEGATEVAADRLPASLDVMARMLARIHRLPTRGLPALPARIDPIPEVFDYLPEGEDWMPLRDRLSGLGETTFRGEPVLLHGDFWPGNLLWRAGRLAAVLDWEDAALGDPASDVACSRLELLWKHGADATARFTRAYAATADLDERRLPLWDVYVALAAARFMASWGLAPERETDMRRLAYDFARDAGQRL